MADTSTTKLHLIKQDPDNQPDILKDHSNLDTLDSEVWARGKTFNGTPVGEDGGFHVRSIPYAENLETSSSQSSDEDYIIRTTGGYASLSDGDAWLTLIKGHYTHTGYTPQSITMTVTPMERTEGQESISATIDDSVFTSYVTQSGTTTLIYSTSWSADPALYGITVTGTPIAGDVITVVYVKEVRGTITQSDPQTFVSTGWNLYNHAVGYARVIKYSNDYGFRISGTYTALEFAETLTGTRQTITPVSGYFTVPYDGYLFVTGGNSTDTQVWMTWSDWGTSANGGVFAPYEEDVIDLSTFMGTNFPYGLLAVGTVQDEINLNIGIAKSKVIRMAYNSTNLANAKASGRQYEYDENYIFLERETAVSYSVSVDGDFAAFDHGMEYFTGTEIAVYAQTLYGANLKNRLERDVLTISGGLVNNLQSTATDKALTAAMGKSLSDHIESLELHNSLSVTNVDAVTGTSKNVSITVTGLYRIIMDCRSQTSTNPSSVKINSNNILVGFGAVRYESVIPIKSGTTLALEAQSGASITIVRLY